MSDAAMQTQRLLLRRPQARDHAALFAIYSDPASWLHYPAGRIQDEDKAWDLLDQWDAHWGRYRFGIWTACDVAEPERVLGFGGLSWRRYGQPTQLNLGFRFAAAQCGRGYATELGRAAQGFAFEQLDEDALWAITRPVNSASQRVLGRLGFIACDELNDIAGEEASLVYRQTAQDYQRQRAQAWLS